MSNRTDVRDEYSTYVETLGGVREIRKVLIANNGIAAVKAIRSIRRWSYETFGSEDIIQFVVMATPEDVRANAEFIRMSDVWVEVPGGSNNHNFANVHLIADIADRYRCDAVWAGWGHASENPALPRQLNGIGVVFLGPDPLSMHALGDKIASTIIAQSAGVPTVAWSGSGIICNYGENRSIPQNMYDNACIKSAQHAERVAEICGYPLVLKASEGGGGKGIRVVLDSTTIGTAFRQVAGEVPGSAIFLMRLVTNARHLEVQLVADESGDAIALHGRDCSVQRRHQKIIEEGPVIAAPPFVWKQLEKAAVALAREVGYVGAGTVEYLYTGNAEGGDFFFLELNPRLQVEHPVTEWITGVDLPSLQLHIGMGISLRNVPSVRKFFNLPKLTAPVSCGPSRSLSVSKVPAPDMPDEPWHGEPKPSCGHVIACRITAENPDEGFQPTAGDIQELTFRNTPNVWGYFSVGASGGVHEFADSQFGHLFAWGENRESSRRSLVLALKELSIRGDIRTTVEYIVKLLEMKSFRDNSFTTDWLDSLIADHVTTEKPPTELSVIVASVCRAHDDYIDRADAFKKCLERGQLPSLGSSLMVFPVELIYDDVKYSFEVTRADVSSFRVKLAKEAGGSHSRRSVLVKLRTLADGAKLVVVDGRSHVCYARREPNGLRLSIGGKVCIFPNEYDPTTLRSSMNGKLVRFLVESGDHVKEGQPYAEVEVMKMYVTLTSPEDGVIRIEKPEGSGVDVGTVIATLELDDPSKVRRAVRFLGDVPAFRPPQTVGSKPHQVFAEAKKNMKLLLRGFDAEPRAMHDFLELLDDPLVAVGEFEEALAALSGRISPKSAAQIENAIARLLESSRREVLQEAYDVDQSSTSNAESNVHVDEDARRIRRSQQVQVLSTAASTILRVTEPIPVACKLCSIAARYSSGSVVAVAVAELLDEYLQIEWPFAKRVSEPSDALHELRGSHRSDLSALVEIVASHTSLSQKNSAMMSFLDSLLSSDIAVILGEENSETSRLKSRLDQLSQLFAPEYADIALKARLVLADLRRPRFYQRKQVVWQLLTSVTSRVDEERRAAMQNVVGLSDSMLDVLVTFVLPAEAGSVPACIRKAAAEAQILRSYRAYNVQNLKVFVSDTFADPLVATWKFIFCKRDGDDISPTVSLKGPVSDLRIPSHGIASFDSADNLSSRQNDSVEFVGSEPFREGVLMAFSNWDQMEERFDAVLEAYQPNSTCVENDINILTVLLRWDTRGQDEVTNQLHANVSTVTDSAQHPLSSEALISDVLSKFCSARPERIKMARQGGIRSITFIVVPPVGEVTTYPGFFTFKTRDGCKEDPIFRHIDPPMAFQLELVRLSNFQITRFGYPGRSVHVFFAQDKAQGKKQGGPPPVPKKDCGTPPDVGTCAVSSADILAANCESTEPSDSTSYGKQYDWDPESSFKRFVSTKMTKINERGSKLPGTASTADRDIDARFFVRAVIRQANVFTSGRGDGVVSIPEAEQTFVEALDAVEMASCDRRFRRTDFNQIFLNVIPAVRIDIEDVETICRRMFQRFATRIWNLRVFVVEIKIAAIVSDHPSSTATIPLRFLLFNPTGHMLKVESYVEKTDPVSRTERIISFSQSNQGSLHGQPVTMPYPVMDRIQRKRVLAQATDTTYVYDFLQIFAKQLQLRWRQYQENRLLGGFRRHKMPLNFIKSSELVLQFNSKTNTSQLVETSRASGLNDIGMIVWRCFLYTPEYPNGREVIIIANDITFLSGSFGPEEDILFLEASRLARREGIPRIFLAANAGARIGVANEVRDKFQVVWVDPQTPSKGVRALAITEARLSEIPKSVCTGRVLKSGLFEITDILGREHGFGVENLMGSGLIAGETSKAYDETFTLTYVSARSVGIGAYLVRLGQRVIQKESAAPIILTGYSALNKVLGGDVYISNEQLGGTKIMSPNGVTHAVVPDDVAGVGAILDWLSFVPKKKGDPLPTVESRDSVARPIECGPEVGEIYDPRRKLLSGDVDVQTGRFLGGFFDKDSWTEYLHGWAKTVIVGRARLGGVPTGIIAVETRSVERVTPADPASPETFERVVPQAGQVWYPDSAAKTARAIKDFDREDLPMFIFANWRGFSGGMRDMFDEVLKCGSDIVDALRSYRHPVFVYIPRGAELRGGAWVVLDTLINPAAIEMYADPTSRGGVLEPEGTVDVKYRHRDILKTMHRLDVRLKQLDEELSIDSAAGVMSDERKLALHDAIYIREAELLPVYRNLAVSFCDLHDTPGRLLAKGAIRRIVPLRDARKFFYWRLQRRLSENRVRKMCIAADPSISNENITLLLRKWATDYQLEGSSGRSSKGSDETSIDNAFDDDGWVFQWLEVEEDAIAKRVAKIRVCKIGQDVKQLSDESRDGFLAGIESALRACESPAARAALVSAIQDKLVGASSSALSSTTRSILSRFRAGWDTGSTY